MGRNLSLQERAVVILLAAVCFTLPAGAVRPGIEVLRDMDFAPLDGKRVGLVTNQTGIDSEGRTTIDILFSSPEVNLVALYGPEHGIRGNAKAGDTVSDSTDAETGLPVFSLYGATRQPTREMLEGVDIIVYDIQDIGTRSYTFISTLGLVMRTCAEMGIPVIVLDRPNPLGGLKIEGSYVEKGYNSFLSQYRIPYIYGLTVGELATLINEEGLNRGQKGDRESLRCKLSVIPMDGWKRSMNFNDTGLPWIPTSPAIPTVESAVGYPSAGICGDLHNWLSIGMNCGKPFRLFAAQWIDGDRLAERLNSYGIPGTRFESISFRVENRWSTTDWEGVQYIYDDYDAACITMTQFYVMQAITELWPEKRAFEVCTEHPTFDKVCGTDRIRIRFSRNYTVDSIRGYWMKDVAAFRKLAKKYWLYEE